MSHLGLQGLNLLAGSLECCLYALPPVLGGGQAVTGRLVLTIQQIQPDMSQNKIKINVDILSLVSLIFV